MNEEYFFQTSFLAFSGCLVYRAKNLQITVGIDFLRKTFLKKSMEKKPPSFLRKKLENQIINGNNHNIWLQSLADLIIALNAHLRRSSLNISDLYAEDQAASSEENWVWHWKKGNWKAKVELQKILFSRFLLLDCCRLRFWLEKAEFLERNEFDSQKTFIPIAPLGNFDRTPLNGRNRNQACLKTCCKHDNIGRELDKTKAVENIQCFLIFLPISACRQSLCGNSHFCQTSCLQLKRCWLTPKWKNLKQKNHYSK